MKNMGDIYRNDIGIGQTQQTIKREHISYPYGNQHQQEDKFNRLILQILKEESLLQYLSVSHI